MGSHSPLGKSAGKALVSDPNADIDGSDEDDASGAAVNFGSGKGGVDVAGAGDSVGGGAAAAHAAASSAAVEASRSAAPARFTRCRPPPWTRNAP